MKNVREKLAKWLSDVRVVKEIKFWLIMLMVVSYASITQKMLNKPWLEFVLICGALLVLYMFIYRVLDTICLHFILKDITDNNSKVKRGILSLNYTFNRVIEEQNEAINLGIKYENCWKLLKNSCEDSDNLDLLKCLDKIETIVDEELNREEK